MATESELLGRITALEREFRRLQGSARTLEARPSGAGRAPNSETYLLTGTPPVEMPNASQLAFGSNMGLSSSTVGGLTTVSLDPGAVTTTGTGPITESVGGTGERTYAKGDLLAGDGTGLTKRTVGANGLALVADSGQSTGLAWSAPTPAAHTHAESDVTNLTTDLSTITTSLALNRQASMQMSPIFATSNLTSTRNLTDGRTFATYIGKAPKDLTSISVGFRMTTAWAAGSSGSWAEVAIATGTPVAQGNPDLTLVAYTNTASTINSLGVKLVAVSATVSAGSDVWVLIGADKGSGGSPVSGVARAQSMADDLGMGFTAAKAATRPSTMAAPTTFTNDGTTALPFWISVSW